MQLRFAKLPDGDLGLELAGKKPGRRPLLIPVPPTWAQDPGSRELVLKEHEGGFERETRTFFDRHLPPDGLFIDAGAHWGLFSLAIAGAHRTNRKVLAIEAHPHNAVRLAKAVDISQLRLKVEVVVCAVGAGGGTTALYEGGTMGNVVGTAANAQRADFNPQGVRARYSVPVVSIDALMNERSSALGDRPVMMKVDVEGNEIAVMEGAADLVASGRLMGLMLEKGGGYVKEPHLSAFGEVCRRLADAGFQAYRLEGPTLVPYELSPAELNVFFLPRGVKPLASYGVT